MLNKIIKFSLFALSLTLPLSLYAQEQPAPIGPEPVVETETTTNNLPTDPFDIELSLGTQSPWSKKVPVIITFTPRIDSTRTQISWDAPNSLSVEKRYDDFFKAADGVTVTEEILVDPSVAGTYNLTVTITDWGYGRNVSSSERINISFDEALVVQPKAANYTLYSFIRYLVIVLFIAIALSAAYFGSRVGIKKLKNWFTLPD